MIFPAERFYSYDVGCGYPAFFFGDEAGWILVVVKVFL